MVHLHSAAFAAFSSIVVTDKTGIQPRPQQPTPL